MTKTLQMLSWLELLSVAVLLINLVTVHHPTVSSILGPLHGGLYLAVAVTALMGRGLSTRTRLCALIPVLSGPLTVRNLRTATVSA
ncbi:hypothetical protein BVC93_26670 [Mycobacterium sp. MS1601]|uniref:hypothetical protein n=1 Tax=Mycobacterium sp. MS1601 TaxID=1936029 RepID=UPI00097906D4|nr:hypothetical protein [Mycobacterium sp. MS1601]AQA05376.1 hypothetical protein BVC93_26670 [Mycobacterium sp. MS1601]